jgi:EmrB/QacA subfamily drug resistance transporter
VPGLTDRNRPWWALIGSCLGLFVLMLDSTVVSLALPSIQRDLDASAASLQWVLNGYLLVIAVLVVTASRLGDMCGRRLVFVVGMGVFAAGSVISGAAWTDTTIIAGRVVQGIGGAALISLSLAIASDAFPPELQARAIGIWTAVSSIALAVGPLFGGVLVELDWRLIFWINLPIAALGVAITLWAARESRDPEAGRRIDGPGLVTLSVGLAALVLALVEGASWGWTSAATLGLAVAGVLLLAGFYLAEHRVENPIVEFELFRNGPYFGATAAAFTLVGSYWVLMYFEPQYLQNVLDYSAIASGLLILPITVPMIAISPFAGSLIARFGPRPLMTAGMLCAAGGLVLLTRIDTGSDYGSVLPGFTLFGIALGLVYAPMSNAAMAAMPRAKSGIAAGVLAMNRVLAGAVALAATGAVFESLKQDRLAALASERGLGLTGSERDELDGLLAGSESARRTLAAQSAGLADRIAGAVRETFTYALSNAIWVLVAITAIGTVLTWAFVRAPATPGADAAVAGSPAASELRHHQHHRRFHL